MSDKSTEEKKSMMKRMMGMGMMDMMRMKNMARVKMESQKVKMRIIGGSFMCMVFSLAQAVFWLQRGDSAGKFDQDAYISDWKDDRSAFNMCMGFRGVKQSDIDDICDDAPCLADINTMWKATFDFNGVVMIALTICFALNMMGAYKVRARIWGGMCGRCWTWCMFVAIIVTAVALFSKQGRLCEKTEVESNYQGDGQFVEGWTFKSDWKAMFAIWLFNLSMLGTFCWGIRKPTETHVDMEKVKEHMQMMKEQKK